MCKNNIDIVIIIFVDLQKRKTKSKKKPFSGVLVSQMLAAREAEKQRIVEVNFFFFSLSLLTNICLNR